MYVPIFVQIGGTKGTSIINRGGSREAQPEGKMKRMGSLEDENLNSNIRLGDHL